MSFNRFQWFPEQVAGTSNHIGQLRDHILSYSTELGLCYDAICNGETGIIWQDKVFLCKHHADLSCSSISKSAKRLEREGPGLSADRAATRCVTGHHSQAWRAIPTNPRYGGSISLRGRKNNKR